MPLTQEKTKQKNANGAGTAFDGSASGIKWTKATGALPPLVILDVSQHVVGKIESVDVTKEITGKGKNKREESRVFYRLSLVKDCSALNVDKKKTLFKAGEIVTLPGTGQIDNALGRVAFKLNGEDPEMIAEKEPPVASLHGIFLFVKRLEDDKMKKGKYAGKKVKKYEIEYGQG